MSNALLKVLDYQHNYVMEENLKSSMNTFAVFNGDGDLHYKPNREICYWTLSSMGKGKSYILSFLKDNRNAALVSEELRKRFLEYIVQRSPYKDVFLIKDVDHIIKYGMLCQTEVPSNLLVGALTVVRSLWEYIDIPLMWEELVNEGVEENLALLAAHKVQKNAKENYTTGKLSSNHRAFESASLGDSIVKAFLSRKPASPEKNYVDTGHYAKIQSLWGVACRNPIFKGYKGKVSKKTKGWELDTEYHYDTSIKPIAEYLKVYYERLMNGKKAAVGKEKGKRAAKPLLISDYLIGLLSVANGFTLAEVRLYRKVLRQVIAGGREHGYRLGPDDVKKPWPLKVDFNSVMNWTTVMRLHEVDFMKVHHHLRDRGAYHHD